MTHTSNLLAVQTQLENATSIAEEVEITENYFFVTHFDFLSNIGLYNGYNIQDLKQRFKNILNHMLSDPEFRTATRNKYLVVGMVCLLVAMKKQQPKKKLSKVAQDRIERWNMQPLIKHVRNITKTAGF
jgi:ubiquinone biosynthesis protein Coq4